LLNHAVLADRLPNHFRVMIPARQCRVKTRNAQLEQGRLCYKYRVIVGRY
jgi:hypothetical protein